MQAVWVDAGHAMQLDVTEASLSTSHRQGSSYLSTALKYCDLSDKRIICSLKGLLRPLRRDAGCSKPHVCLCERKICQLSPNNFNMKRSLGTKAGIMIVIMHVQRWSNLIASVIHFHCPRVERPREAH
jgi:hypothetical protein